MEIWLVEIGDWTSRNEERKAQDVRIIRKSRSFLKERLVLRKQELVNWFVWNGRNQPRASEFEWQNTS
jgi:hypothetical protein